MLCGMEGEEAGPSPRTGSAAPEESGFISHTFSLTHFLFRICEDQEPSQTTVPDSLLGSRVPLGAESRPAHWAWGPRAAQA